MCLTSTRHQLGLRQTQPNSEQAAKDTKNSRMPVKTSATMASVCRLAGTSIMHFLRALPDSQQLLAVTPSSFLWVHNACTVLVTVCKPESKGHVGVLTAVC